MTVNQEWLDAAIELQMASTAAGVAVISLEKLEEADADAACAARALRYRLDWLRGEAKNAQGRGEPVRNLAILRSNFYGVERLAAAKYKRCIELIEEQLAHGQSA